MLRSRIAAIAVAVTTILPATAHARDWFCRAGATGGDGSKAKPFGDPWMALEKVEAGDKVHVAEGQYFGKLEGANWVIPFPNVELLGGYDGTFQERNPWKHVTELAWKKGGAKEPDISLPRVSANSSRDTSGAVIDGFLIDMSATYDYDKAGNLVTSSLPGAVELRSPGSALRNCVIVNSLEAVQVGPGVTVENDVIVGAVGMAIRATGGGSDAAPAIIRNDTIAVVWGDIQSAGNGGAQGIGIAASIPVQVENTLIVHADNHGISMQQSAPASKSALTGNVFYRNLYSNLRFSADGKDSAIDDSNLDDLEDAGLGKATGNSIADPGLPFDRAWYDAFTRRCLGAGKQYKPEDWTATRKAAGLGPTTPAPQEIFAPVYPAKAAVALIAPRNPAVKAGARVRALPVTFGPATVATPVSRAWTKTTIDAIDADPKAWDGKAVEVLGGVLGVTSSEGASGVDPATHAGHVLVDPKGETQIRGFVTKGSSTERFVDAIPNYGSGPPKDLFVIHGVARALSGYPKSGIVVDDVTAYEAPVVATKRPVGKDWFVRAGESGGDGSREKPFKDPYQAIEKAGKGDRIHVTEGEYGGKLKSGHWVVDKPWIAILGGYDHDFKTRDPWEHPTVLAWPKDSKTKPQGYLLEGSDDHTGLLLDGLVFDRKSLNQYEPDGSLDSQHSDDTEHLWVFAPEVTVRNCVFLNGAGGAVRMSTGQLFENNLVVNVLHGAISINQGNPGPAVLKDNTIAFVWEPRFHDPQNSSGTGVEIRSQSTATLDSNLFEYVDNIAVKSSIRPGDETLTGNDFWWDGVAAFRFTQGEPPPTVADKALAMLPDLGFRKCEANTNADAGLAIDPDFYGRWFARTSQVTDTFSEADWKKIAPKGPPPKEGFAPAYDYHKAATLFPRNPAVKAGAKRKKLEIDLGS